MFLFMALCTALISQGCWAERRPASGVRMKVFKVGVHQFGWRGIEGDVALFLLCTGCREDVPFSEISESPESTGSDFRQRQ